MQTETMTLTLWDAETKAPTVVGFAMLQAAVSGQPAPGTSATFERLLGPPALNASGNVTFTASLSDPAAATADSVWMCHGGVLQLVAQAGDVPSGAHAAIASVHDANLTDTNMPGYSALLESGEAAACTEGRVAETGEDAPGVPGGRFKNTLPHSPPFDAPIALNGDRSAFSSPLFRVPPDVAGGVWSGPAGNLQLVTQRGQPAPGVDGTFTSFGQVRMNASGTVLFPATAGEGITGLWTGGADALRPVVYTGMAATGTPGAFSRVIGETLSPEGGVAFAAAGEPAGVWYVMDGEATPLAVPGQEATGAGNGAVFGRSFGRPAVNEGGTVVFTADYTGPNGPGRAVFTAGADGIQSLAFARVEAPGTDGDRFLSFADPLISPEGAVAFTAQTEGGTNGLWVASNGGLVPVALVGQPFLYTGVPLDGFDLYTGGTGDNGLPRSFGKGVSLALTARLADGSTSVWWISVMVG